MLIFIKFSIVSLKNSTFFAISIELFSLLYLLFVFSNGSTQRIDFIKLSSISFLIILKKFSSEILRWFNVKIDENIFLKLKISDSL